MLFDKNFRNLTLFLSRTFPDHDCHFYILLTAKKQKKTTNIVFVCVSAQHRHYQLRKTIQLKNLFFCLID